MSAADVRAPTRHPMLTDVDLGVAVQPEDRGDPVEASLGDDVDGAAGHGLLAGSKTSRTVPLTARRPGRARRARAPRRRRTVVCTSCPQAWATPCHLGAVGDVLVVLSSPARRGRREGPRPGPAPSPTDRQVADQAGADQQPRPATGRGRAGARATRVRGDGLGAAELRMGVELTAQLHEKGLGRHGSGRRASWDHPAILGRRRHGPKPTRSCHPFGRAGTPRTLPNYTNVTRLRQLPPDRRDHGGHGPPPRPRTPHAPDGPAGPRWASRPGTSCSPSS